MEEIEKVKSLFGGEKMVKEIISDAIIQVIGNNKDTSLPSSSPSSASSASSVMNTSSGSNGDYLGNHSRFTSNASTSSIHNDLKLVLEEGKGIKRQPTTQQQQQQKSNLTDELRKVISPKPQRTIFSSQQQKSSKQNKSMNDSQSSTKTNRSITQQPSSSNEEMNLIEMMMKLMKNDPKKNKYRYSRDFLLQVRQERAAFVDQIYPDIFRTYCYCMNGKYWDPEKYFDIIQLSGKFEDNDQQHMNEKTLNNRFKNNNNRLISSTSSYNNNNSKNKSNKSIESPKPLLVPFNSPLDQHHHHHHHHHVTNSSQKTTKEINDKSNTDILLLDLIRNKENTPSSSTTATTATTTKNINLLDIINKKSPVVPSISSIMKEKSPSRKQLSSPSSSAIDSLVLKPKLMTARELETMQLNQCKQEQQKMKRSATTTIASPSSSSSLSSSSSDSMTPMATLTTTTTTTTTMLTNQGVMKTTTEKKKKLNGVDMLVQDMIKQTGDAHKNSVNQSSSSSSSSSKSSGNGSKKQQSTATSNENLNDIIKKLHSSVATARINEDSTNAIKQLLNLNDNKNKKNTTDAPSKSSKNRNHHHHHNHNNNKSKTTENQEKVLGGDNLANIEKALIENNNNKKKDNKQHNKQKSSKLNKTNENIVETLLNMNQFKTAQKQNSAMKGEELNRSSDYSHFNNLLNKIMPQQQQQSSSKMTQSQSMHSNVNYQGSNSENKVDILKWFQNSNRMVQKPATGF